ncbi:PD-(D/E)XK nuclease-like domain-containing protein [Limosilactobacillus equigenerosi]|uniref:PD-(D/E)XK nuclease-like domain-containing protein n=1 Tax=Limosilactobacillus equigenerosi TaxID=417373 RepID=UPI000B0F0540|nr:PD-(D/E)XK nuclease-like domain-containing protein [Limosilactobacillus equigenerosi]
MELTQNNYYAHETDYHYLSFSLYKDFMKCEAAALAKLKEDWQPTSNPTPLLVGNYVHSTFESEQAHEKWLNRSELGDKTNRELMMTKPTKKDPDGHLRAEFKLADEMIKTLKDDDLFNFVYQPGDGEKEVIVTGKMDGIQWKGKIDSLNLERGYFVDLKTVDDIHKKHWIADESRWGNFIESRGYVMQMAIYKELIKQTFGVDCQPYMFAVSKQTPPDKMAFDFQGDAIFQMEEAIQQIKENQGNIIEVMTGEEKPKYCGKCEYCRSTKKIKWIYPRNRN